MTQKPEIWYRVEGVCYANGVDVHGDPCPGKGPRKLEVRKYGVIKHTPKGVWLVPHYTLLGYFDYPFHIHEDKRWVNASSRKRFACPTLDEAYDSFLARKRRQARILSSQLEDANTFIRLAEATKAGKEKELLP